MAGFHPWRALKVGARALFGYHAVADKHRRQAPRSTTQSEDRTLDTSDRRKLLATSRDNARNQSLYDWIIQTNADFVSRFRFQPQTDNEELNARLDALIAWRGRPANWDVTGRMSRDEFMRCAEVRRSVDGDTGLHFLNDGRMQGIEADRIAMPSRDRGQMPEYVRQWYAAGQIVHGVRINRTGGPTHYIVCRRNQATGSASGGGSDLLFQAVLRAKNVYLLGYFDRYDQIRGVPQGAPSLTHLQDAYEVMELENTKIKNISQFGLFFKRAATTNGDGFGYTDADTGEEPTADTDRYEFDLKPGFKLEGEPGDEVQVVETKTPGTEVIEYLQLLTRFGLASYGIPYCFWDGRGSSYSEQRQKVIQYLRRIESAQDAHHEFHMRKTAMDLALWANTPSVDDPSRPILELPAGMAVRDIRYDWLPEAFPWIDPQAEITGDMLAVSAGFQSRDDVCKRRTGRRYADVVAELGREEALANEASATIAIGQPGQITTREEEPDNAANTPTEQGA